MHSLQYLLCVKKVTGPTICHKLLEELMDVTRPEGFPRETKHTTRYHIETTTGPPIVCRPGGLTPDSLIVATNEFNKMLKSGTIRPLRAVSP